MLKILAIFISLILLSFIGLKQFGATKNERTAISEAISIANKDKPLKNEEKALLEIQLAIVDFTSRNGNPPVQLQDLVPTYFDTVPVDPTTGKEFPYSSQGKMYSLGMQVELKNNQLAGSNNQPGVAESVTTSRTTGKQFTDNDGDFVNPNTLKEDFFVYNAKGKRDPFMPFGSAKIKPTGSSPLEQIDLGELRFTGVISKPSGEKMAMVEDASGRGYSVSMGTKIGLRSGLVLDIQEDVFKILETYTDAAGKERKQLIEKKKIAANEEITKSRVTKGKQK